MIGLDISENNIKLVEVKETASGPVLTKFAIAEVSAKLQGDDPDQALAKTISETLKEHAFEGKEVFSSISGPSVQVRHIKLPAMPENELNQAVRWEAKNFVTFPIEDAVINYFRLEEEGINSGKQDIILMAIEGKAFKRHLALVEKAGLKLAGVTLAPFAQAELMKISSPAEKNELVALIDIGEKVASLNLYKNHVLQFNREITMAGELAPEEPDTEKLLNKLSDEISSSFEFYREHFSEEPISRAYLSGGSSQLNTLVQHLSQNLNLSLLPLELNNISPGPSLDQAKFRLSAPRLSLALGLAISRGRALNLLKTKKEETDAKAPDFLKIIDRIYIPNSVIVGLLLLLIGSLTFYNLKLNQTMFTLKGTLDEKNLKLTHILKLQNRKAALQEIIKKQINVKSLLASVNALMPRGLSLAYINFDNDKREVRLGGEAKNPQTASAFVKSIEDSPYFSDTRLNEIKKELGVVTFKMDFKVN